MSTQFVEGKFRAETTAGLPMSAGRLYTYAVGTTTWQTTYTDYTLGSQNTYVNDGAGGKYIQLDANGEASVWLGAGLTYTFVLKDSTGATRWTDDGIKAKADAATTADTATTATTATKATNIVGGAAGRVAYQSATDTTQFSVAGTSGQVFISGGTSAPSWTSSPALASPTATTQSAGDNSTKVATTAYVATAITAAAVSGTYTPTLTAVSNVTASTSALCTYIKAGSVVAVSGFVSVTPTAATTSTSLRISLPVASAFATGNEGYGVAVRSGNFASQNISGIISANAATDDVLLAFYCDADTASRAWLFHFQYQVI
jgi:hypothetical protein